MSGSMPSLQGCSTLPAPLLLLPHFWLHPPSAAGKATQRGPFSSHFCKESKHRRRSSAAAGRARGHFPLPLPLLEVQVPPAPGCMTPPQGVCESLKGGSGGTMPGTWWTPGAGLGASHWWHLPVAVQEAGDPSVCGNRGRAGCGGGRRAGWGHGTMGDNEPQ